MCIQLKTIFKIGNAKCFAALLTNVLPPVGYLLLFPLDHKVVSIYWSTVLLLLMTLLPLGLDLSSLTTLSELFDPTLVNIYQYRLSRSDSSAFIILFEPSDPTLAIMYKVLIYELSSLTTLSEPFDSTLVIMHRLSRSDLLSLTALSELFNPKPVVPLPRLLRFF